MSLITRCPACQTLFKVVPDQLRISEGWVRCGQCAEIFDASLNLLQPGQTVGNPLTVQERAIPEVPGSEALQAVAAPVDHIDLDLELPSSTDEIQPDREPVLIETPKPETSLTLQDPMDAERATVPPPEPLIPAAPADIELAVGRGPDLRSDLSDVSFMRESSSRPPGSGKLMRLTLAFVSLALILALVGQVARHERDRIVALHPSLTPWLAATCQAMNCTLSPLKRIESVVIENSSFTRIRGDSYRLSLTLKNTAGIALAWPALELTLTDSLDQPVVRRVFMSSEMESPSETFVAGLEWPASLTFAVSTKNGVERIAGYRLLAFYP
jgi:predicted Zn finger-like uncharacterized protein